MRRLSRHMACGLAVSAAALVVACGSQAAPSSSSAAGGGQAATPTNSTGTSSSLDACTVLTASEATQLAGATVAKHSSIANQGGLSTCVYDDSAGDNGAAAVVGAAGVAASDPQGALKSILESTPHGSGGTEESVNGIGDAALKDVRDHGAGLAFIKGSTMVVLAVTGASRDGASIEADLETLAHQIVGQI